MSVGHFIGLVKSNTPSPTGFLMFRFDQNIPPLTLYVARHSWASTAKAKGIPIAIISEGLGHDSETTTQIYLASLDASVVDKANSLIMKSLK